MYQSVRCAPAATPLPEPYTEKGRLGTTLGTRLLSFVGKRAHRRAFTQVVPAALMLAAAAAVDD